MIIILVHIYKPENIEEIILVVSRSFSVSLESVIPSSWRVSWSTSRRLRTVSKPCSRSRVERFDSPI